MLLTPTLYNSAKQFKLFRYIELKRNKWNCKEEGSNGCFLRSNVQAACLDGDEIEMEGRGIMV